MGGVGRLGMRMRSRSSKTEQEKNSIFNTGSARDVFVARNRVKNGVATISPALSVCNRRMNRDQEPAEG